MKIRARAKKHSLTSGEIVHKFWSKFGYTTMCCLIRSVIELVIKQVGLPLQGCPILLVNHAYDGLYLAPLF